ncbi:MAG: GreA/GreB family elongation factor [Myxococcota bacterium]|nr:GreA/GreB family elongation factor [Myxococcota bacterium]
MPRQDDKASLRDELHAALVSALETARAAHAAAVEGATHSEAKAENDKDTRGLEQSYLARGQAQRVAELEAAASDVAAMKLRTFADGDAVAMSALVVVEDDGKQQRYFIAPGGGGTALRPVAGSRAAIQVVTPASPIGTALIGKRVDDVVEFRGRELAIVSVA